MLAHKSQHVEVSHTFKYITFLGSQEADQGHMCKICTCSVSLTHTSSILNNFHSLKVDFFFYNAYVTSIMSPAVPLKL